VKGVGKEDVSWERAKHAKVALRQEVPPLAPFRLAQNSVGLRAAPSIEAPLIVILSNDDHATEL
jgi:hypothetical protein